MASAPRTPLDPQTLEARTQAIGRELFAAATREHAHLSVPNRWTAKVLSWCLDDPALKSSVLRFIDVLPSLQDPREIARHVREYFPSKNLRLPAALRLGSSLAGPGLLTRGALACVIHQLTEQVARQFIARAVPDEAARVMQDLAARGATCSLDILGEQVLSEPEADRYAAQCLRLLQVSATVDAQLRQPPLSCGPRVNVSVKPSALTPRFDPIAPKASVGRAAARLRPLLRSAGPGALINLDMERYELRDLTLQLLEDVAMGASEAADAQVGLVIQAYLRDAGAALDRVLALAAALRRPLTIRLVKGAYWDFELAQARQRRWPVPVHQQKAATDAAFERLTRRLLAAAPGVTTAIASHNVRSIAHAMAAAEIQGLPKTQLEFQLLYGMGDALHAAIVGRGYPVRIYTPIGELIPGMAYLVRRILENTANESFLRQEFLQERSPDELLAPPQPAEAEPDPKPAVQAAWPMEPPADFSQAPARASMAGALAAVRGELGRSYPALLDQHALERSTWLTSRNPASPEQVLGRVAQCDAADVEQAVRVAAAAQPGWARTPARERAQRLTRAAALLRERRAALAAWVVTEVGKPWREADVDVVEAIEYLEYYSQHMLELAGGRPVLQLPGERNAYRYVPRGVAVVIAPWNFPAAILTGMTAAALVSGNSVILKPAEQSSIIGVQIAQLLREAGVPPGALQCLPGAGEEVGAALVRHPGTHVVLFTGSKAVGLSIIDACRSPRPGQRFIKHAITEMGGKNAIVVDADADLDAAVQGIVRSAFGYAGQKCSAASRLIVDEAVYDRLLPRLIAAVDCLVVGDPADPATDIGPLIDETALHRLAEATSRAGTEATVAYQYPAARLPRAGYFFGPTIVTDVAPGDRLAREELFGPLLCVFRVGCFAEALALANDTDYALTGGVYSRSPSRIEEAIRAFDVGNLYINRPITGAMVGRQPFGGHRLSGLGTKAGGPDYLLQLLIPKTIATDTTRHGMPLE